MSENIKKFIDQLAAGENADAKETLENELATRAFASLDEYKKELAKGIFADKEEQEVDLSIESDSETEVQETE